MQAATRADALAAIATNPVAVLDEVRRERARRSLLAHTQQIWHVLEPGREMKHGKTIEAICEMLEAVTHGEIRKALINVPPGCMKSLLTNVAWPTWEWGPQGMPEMRYVCASYAERLSIRDNRKCRNVIISKLELVSK